MKKKEFLDLFLDHSDTLEGNIEKSLTKFFKIQPIYFLSIVRIFTKS